MNKLLFKYWFYCLNTALNSRGKILIASFIKRIFCFIYWLSCYGKWWIYGFVYTFCYSLVWKMVSFFQYFSWYIIIIIIIFISSWCKIVKNTNKNQSSSRYNYSFHATKRTKENVRLDIISSVVRTTASIYWITINTIQLKLYYK